MISVWVFSCYFETASHYALTGPNGNLEEGILQNVFRNGKRRSHGPLKTEEELRRIEKRETSKVCVCVGGGGVNRRK